MILALQLDQFSNGITPPLRPAPTIGRSAIVPFRRALCMTGPVACLSLRVGHWCAQQWLWSWLHPVKNPRILRSLMRHVTHRSGCGLVNGNSVVSTNHEGSKTIRGEPASARETRAATLYSVGPVWGPDHEAAMRFSSEAPRRRAHSNERRYDRVLARVTATSDRHQRPTRGVAGAETGKWVACLLAPIRPRPAARRRVEPRRS